MAINRTISDTVHLRDNWSDTVVGAGGIARAISDTVHLRDNLVRSIDALDQQFRFIEDTVHLRDSITHIVAGGAGYNVAISDTVHLRDDYNRIVEIATIRRYVFDEVHLRDDYEMSVVNNMTLARNQNITFGDTEEPNYKEYSHRFRWTNYNGVAVPDLNFKDLKEPILRVIPAPSFLQFEYGNSFILFTRNSINRFILDGDVETGQWRAQTDNLIEEFRDFGLMAPKTLCLAADTLFGLSEKGVWRWNKDGMELISDKIIAIPDAGDFEYIGFYCPIRNQYILHKQDIVEENYRLTAGAIEPNPTIGDGEFGNRKSLMLTSTKMITFTNALGAIPGASLQSRLYIIISTVDGDARTVVTESSVELPGGSVFVNQWDMVKVSDTKCIIEYWNGGVHHLAVVNIAGNVATITGEVTIPAVLTNLTAPTEMSLLKLSSTRFATFFCHYFYVTFTLAGDVITLDTIQSNWFPDSAQIMTHSHFESAYLEDGMGVVVGACGRNGVYWGQPVVFTCTDLGAGGGATLSFGNRADTGLDYDIFYPGFVDIKVVGTSTIWICMTKNGGEFWLQIAYWSGTAITLGERTDGGDTLTDYYVRFANRTDTGFWITYLKKDDITKSVAMWGVVEEIAGNDTLVLQEDITVELNYSTGGGKNDIITLDGFANKAVCTINGYSVVIGIDFDSCSSFVYQIDRKVWGTFLGLDIADVPVILSGGNLDDNYNIWLNSYRTLKKYPGTTITTSPAYIRTKEFYIQEGVFQRWMVDFEGTDVDVETRVTKEVGGVDVEETDKKESVAPNKFRGLPLGKMRGRKMSVKIIDADIIKTLSLDVKGWGER